MTLKACQQYRSVVLGLDNIAQIGVLDGVTFSDSPEISALSLDGVHYESESVRCAYPGGLEQHFIKRVCRCV